jgi:hypothetical protein
MGEFSFWTDDLVFEVCMAMCLGIYQLFRAAYIFISLATEELRKVLSLTKFLFHLFPLFFLFVFPSRTTEADTFE